MAETYTWITKPNSRREAAKGYAAKFSIGAAHAAFTALEVISGWEDDKLNRGHLVHAPTYDKKAMEIRDRTIQRVGRTINASADALRHLVQRPQVEVSPDQGGELIKLNEVTQAPAPAEAQGTQPDQQLRPAA